VDDAQKKTRTLSSKLKAVEAMPDATPSVEITPDDLTSEQIQEH